MPVGLIPFKFNLYTISGLVGAAAEPVSRRPLVLIKVSPYFKIT